MEITASMVKELRERTQAGMMDVKRALQEAEGDMDRAADILREKGLSKAAKKADRIAAEGLVKIAISADAKTGAVPLNTMPTELNTLRSGPPQEGQVVSGSSENFWNASRSFEQSWQRY